MRRKHASTRVVSDSLILILRDQSSHVLHKANPHKLLQPDADEPALQDAPVSRRNVGASIAVLTGLAAIIGRPAQALGIPGLGGGKDPNEEYKENTVSPFRMVHVHVHMHFGRWAELIGIVGPRMSMASLLELVYPAGFNVGLLSSACDSPPAAVHGTVVMQQSDHSAGERMLLSSWGSSILTIYLQKTLQMACHMCCYWHSMSSAGTIPEQRMSAGPA